MKKTFFICALCLAATAGNAQEAPTMGWSSWNTFALNINENIIKGQADAMVAKGLKDAGYKFINIDDGYFGGRDANGNLLIHPTRFPNGLRPVVDYIHSKGLKAGIYSDAGKNTCGSYFGGDKTGVGVGLLGHDQQDCNLFFKTLNFDFIKVDFCGGSPYHNADKLKLSEQARYTAIAEAITSTGKKHVRMNACRWDYPGTWISNVAASWRTTQDINCSWGSIKNILAQNLYLSAYAHDGHFNDMDMLEVGRTLTPEEDRTHFGMWCIMASPLLIGCDMSKLEGKALELLANRELIALNQDKLYKQAYVAKKSNDCYVMVKDVKKLNGNQRAVAIYNPNDESKDVTLDFNWVDLAGNVKVRDLFEHKDCGSHTIGYCTSVPAHGTAIYMLDAQKRNRRIRYEAECGYISDYQELENNQAARTGIYEYDDNCSGGMKATWLGCSSHNDLTWNNVYVDKTGEYTLKIAVMTTEERDLHVEANGIQVGVIKTDKDGTANIKVRLNKGMNTIRLHNNDSWMPNIDYIDIL